MMDIVGVAIAGLLPPAYRGAYGDEVGELEEARRLARELFADATPASDQA
jgi:hypothetical protein